MNDELDYYKKQVDTLAGANLQLEYAAVGLRHRLKQKTRALTLLTELERHLPASGSLEESLRVAVSLMDAHLPVDRIVALVAGDEDGSYLPLAWAGFPSGSDHAFSTTAVSFRLTLVEAGGYVASDPEEPDLGSVESVRNALQIPYFAFFPVVLDGHPQAMLVMGRLKQDRFFHPPFDDGDVETLSAIATLIASFEQSKTLRLLREVEDLRKRFFANISHELRTPLTLSVSELQHVRSELTAEASLASRVDRVLRSQRRLLALINQILDLRKLEAGAGSLKIACVTNIGALIRSVAEPFVSVARDRGLDFRIDIDRSLQDDHVYVDVEAFERLISNLLWNAIKFTPQGHIELIARKDSNGMVLRVCDTGVGIARRDLTRLFDEFAQGAQAAVEGDVGSGIGLALVKEIARAHGGSVSVQSEPPAGTTFTVILPIGRGHLDERLVAVPHEAPAPREPSDERPLIEQQTATLNTTTRSAFDRHKKTVLYVEDDPELREHIYDFLNSDYNVFLASDGREGLELAQREHPDLILTDEMMPVMSGTDMLVAIRAQPELRDVPVVFLTARTGSEARIRSLEGGADDYLTKPFDPQELAVRVRNLLRARAQAHELLRLNSRIVELVSGRGLIDQPQAVPASASPDTPPVATFRKEGELFRISHEGKTVMLKDSKGLRALSRLLQVPGREIHCLDLAGMDAGIASPPAATVDPGGDLHVSAAKGEDVIDARARQEYERRLKWLREDIEEAEALNDIERASAARLEMQFLTDEIASSLGLGGRPRTTSSPAERARVNVTRAIRTAIAKIAAQDAALGQHLTVAVQTGSFCSYQPDPRAPICWSL